jgi:hypothetical protein
MYPFAEDEGGRFESYTLSGPAVTWGMNTGIPVYHSLEKRVNDQRTKMIRWRHDIVNEARGLREAFASVLKAPEEPVAIAGLPYRYVDLVDIKNPGSPPPPLFPDDAYTSNLEFVFGISLTFKAGAEHAVYVAQLGARYKDEVIEFCTWDPMSCAQVGGGWQRDKDVLIAEVLDLLDQRLAFDPFRGPREKAGIGFIELK